MGNDVILFTVADIAVADLVILLTVLLILLANPPIVVAVCRTPSTRLDKLGVAAGNCADVEFSTTAVAEAVCLAKSDKNCGLLGSSRPKEFLIALNADPDTPLTEFSSPVKEFPARDSAVKEFAIPPKPPIPSDSLAAACPAPIAFKMPRAPTAALVSVAVVC